MRESAILYKSGHRPTHLKVFECVRELVEYETPKIPKNPVTVSVSVALTHSNSKLSIHIIYLHCSLLTKFDTLRTNWNQNGWIWVCVRVTLTLVQWPDCRRFVLYKVLYLNPDLNDHFTFSFTIYNSQWSKNHTYIYTFKCIGTTYVPVLV